MTRQTMDWVLRYAKTSDVAFIPAVIQGMQEDDHFSNIIQFKNSFRLLRNLAAHEPETITKQIKSGDNIGNSKIVFIPINNDVKNWVVVDMVQFTAWMLDAYLVTDNIAYLTFWHTLMLDLYPVYKARLNANKVNKRVFEFKPNKYSNGLMGLFLNYQEFMFKVFGKPKTIAPQDPYALQIYESNTRVFWRMAYPDMMDVVALLVDGTIEVSDKDNIRGFLTLFKEREGV